MFDSHSLYWDKKEYYRLRTTLDFARETMSPQKIVEAEIRVRELEESFAQR